MAELECQPYGAGHGDEGICLLVRMGPHRILLDCGLQDISRLQSDPTSAIQGDVHPEWPADLVLCSHAHSDHAQGLLPLHQAFPQLPIYGSEVTTQLLPLNWPELNPAEPVSFCQALPWRSPVEIAHDLSVKLLPAGHLPGAAAFLLTYTPAPRTDESGVRPYTLLYTGDFFLSNARLVEGLHLEEFRGLAPDVLIIEGTFGTAHHPHRRSQENQLAERIHRAVAQGLSVILPVPVLGLGQELLMLLRSHHYFTGRDIDIWVDRRIAAGCDAYLKVLLHLPSNVQNFARHQPLFWDERVRPRVRRLYPEQCQLVGQSPCIVLAQTDDLSEYRPGPGRPWLMLLPQHLSQASIAMEHFELPERGRTLQRRIQPDPLAIETYLLAQHCDGPGTTQLIHNLRPQHVVFVHGSPTYLADLAGLDELNNRYHLHCPATGSRVELPVGETFLQPTIVETETSYEGELTELGTTITIALSNTITANPRWQAFSDTGLVEARWQGEDLILRGLSQQELLLSRRNSFAISPNLKCCANCQYYRGQRCWNPASPLSGFKVALEGYCPAFETINPQDTRAAVERDWDIQADTSEEQSNLD